MIVKDLQTLYTRDLDRLYKEIELYNDEAVLWEVVEGINNCGGNLCLHIVGNLNYFIGAILGGTGYVRNREFEFSAVGVPQEAMLRDISATKKMITSVLESITSTDLSKQYPINVLGKEMTIGLFLIHLDGHLTYHMGQINYHRRILC